MRDNPAVNATNESEVAARLDAACRAADEVQRLTMEWFQSPALRPENKHDGTVVTAIDRQAEQIIRRHIASQFRDDGVLGEEFGDSPGRSGWRWIVDPIDGTSSFVRGIPTFVTLIGIEAAGDLVAGVMDAPAMGERLTTQRGRGTQWRLRSGEIRPARVSATDRLSDAMLELGPYRSYHRHGYAALYERLSLATRRNRGWSDGYAYMLVATGRVDAAIYFGFKPWDLAPAIIAIEEAGGAMTSWTGARSADMTHVVASNGALHADLRAMLPAGAG